MFTEFIVAKLKHYVYRLIDPRDGTTFYVGRGQGNRVFSHAAGQLEPSEAEDSASMKLRTIREIRNTGLETQYVIHRHGLDEDCAVEVEAALIDAYPGLTNILEGRDPERGCMHPEEVNRLYDAPEAHFEHRLVLVCVTQSLEDRDLYDAARYAWRVSPQQAETADYVLGVRRGIIIGAFEVEGDWLLATPENFPGFPIVDGHRYGFRGREAPDEVKRLYLHKRVPHNYRFFGAAFRYVNFDN